MAQQLDMTVTQYLQLKDKLVPKHLSTNEQQRQRQIHRKLVESQSPIQMIQKAKKKYLRPINEIQTIMNHFDSKFSQQRVKQVDKVTPHKKKTSRMGELIESEHNLQTKMKYLINLPSIHKIKKDAQRYKAIINADAIKERQQQKSKIIDKFNEYMEAELKGNPRLSIKHRTNTIH